MNLKKIYNQLKENEDVGYFMKDIPDVLTACEKEGNTLLHWAILDNKFILAEKLLEAGAYPFIFNENYVTACSLIVRIDNKKLLRMILEKYPNSLPTSSQSELLVTAAVSGQYEQLKLMLESGFNVKNKYGEDSIVGWALQSQRLDIIELLYEYGASLDEENDYGQTPLHIASSEGMIEIVKYLIKMGANINHQSGNGDTPLMTACAWNQYKIVEFLLEANADITCENFDNKTALKFAKEGGGTEIIEIIENKLSKNNYKKEYVKIGSARISKK